MDIQTAYATLSAAKQALVDLSREREPIEAKIRELEASLPQKRARLADVRIGKGIPASTTFAAGMRLISELEREIAEAEAELSRLRTEGWPELDARHQQASRRVGEAAAHAVAAEGLALLALYRESIERTRTLGIGVEACRTALLRRFDASDQAATRPFLDASNLFGTAAELADLAMRAVTTSGPETAQEIARWEARAAELARSEPAAPLVDERAELEMLRRQAAAAE